MGLFECIDNLCWSVWVVWDFVDVLLFGVELIYVVMYDWCSLFEVVVWL